VVEEKGSDGGRGQLRRVQRRRGLRVAGDRGGGAQGWPPALGQTCPQARRGKSTRAQLGLALASKKTRTLLVRNTHLHAIRNGLSPSYYATTELLLCLGD
jgi:hypothetical protein